MPYLTKKAFEVIKALMGQRTIDFTEEDQNILTHVFEDTKVWR